MYVNKEIIILASGSPRRKQFLDEMGLEFTVESADINEQPLNNELPDDFVNRMAQEKAMAVSEKIPVPCVISGDTVVCLDGEILGKPADEVEAVELLMSLSGQLHEVKTGVCVIHQAQNLFTCRIVTTEVLFENYSRSLAEAYVAAGESLDKAGGYGIQGKGIFLVKSIKGSYSNVVGLPVNELAEILLSYNIIGVAKSSCS